ncbi:MAG: glycogen/starch synthase [Leadbetterella sp.]
MDKLRILFISSEIEPFHKISKIATLLKKIPQEIQERGMEIRILIPRFGLINERKHRLHEVVRLSGMNISVGENEKPLIIKVASIPAAKLQVYFLDNEDYFQRKTVYSDKSNKFYDDNHERAIFFCKGVLETVKKFGWAPDVVHCTDWFTSFVPLYLKTTYKNDPIYKTSKCVFGAYDTPFTHTFGNDIFDKARMLDVSDDHMTELRKADYNSFIRIAALYSDLFVHTNRKMVDSKAYDLSGIDTPQKSIFLEEGDNVEDFYTLYKSLYV